MGSSDELVSSAQRYPKFLLIFPLDCELRDLRPRWHGIGDYISFPILVSNGDLERGGYIEGNTRTGAMNLPIVEVIWRDMSFEVIVRLKCDPVGETNSATQSD